MRGVDLGAAGLGVVEVAPREHRDAAQARVGGDVAELGDDIVGGTGRIRNRARGVYAAIRSRKSAEARMACDSGPRCRVAYLPVSKLTRSIEAAMAREGRDGGRFPCFDGLRAVAG